MSRKGSDAAESAGHVALIVEDDVHVSKSLVVLVESLGHTARTAFTLRQASAEIERDGYCYVLLDMQIPSDEGNPPLMTSGKTVLARLRKRSPERAESGAWALPIIVVTSYAKDHEFVSELFEDGASGFIPKPFDNGIDAVGRKILSVLSRAGRADHEACCVVPVGAPRLTASAGKRVKPPRISSSATLPKSVTLSIPGESDGRRVKVVLDGKACFLEDSFFAALLTAIGLARLDRSAFHDKAALRFGHAPHVPSRIRARVAEETGLEQGLLEGDGHGGWRLHTNLILGEVAWAKLQSYGDETIARLARQFAEKSVESSRP